MFRFIKNLKLLFLVLSILSIGWLFLDTYLIFGSSRSVGYVTENSLSDAKEHSAFHSFSYEFYVRGEKIYGEHFYNPFAHFFDLPKTGKKISIGYISLSPQINEPIILCYLNIIRNFSAFIIFFWLYRYFKGWEKGRAAFIFTEI